MRRVIGAGLRWFGRAACFGMAGLGLMLAGANGAAAQASGGGAVGAPHSWGIALQEAFGPVKEHIHSFNNLVLVIIVLITIFVLALLAYVVWRFREEANPTPSRTSHNTLLEVAWTVVPILILLIIAIPSFRLIYYADRTRDADLTITVQGRQWYWHYAYPDHGTLAYDSRPIPDSDLKPGQLRSLSVDEPLVIPVGANVRVLTTGQDVIHSFFVPSLGVQKYTIPGRTLETWFRADREGTYYGQCNQICGTNHWFMPIEVRAISQDAFRAWVEEAKKKYAAAPATSPVVAAATTAAPTLTTPTMATPNPAPTLRLAENGR